MALEYYVSAEWVADEEMGTRVIKATGNDGSVWYVPETMCDIPPWPQFLVTEAGKTFLAMEAPDV
jgi:hypothetical protein